MAAPATAPRREAEQPLRVAVWRRLSTLEQNSEGRAGLQRQRDQTDRVVAAAGYQVVVTFEVVDVSGTSVALAPEFQKLLALVESGDVKGVVVSELSRIARPDSLESLAVFDHFARSGCLVIVDGQSIDFANPEGWLSGGLQALVAGHFRMNMLRTIHAAKESSRRNGWLVSSYKTLPLGVSYEKTARRFFYNEDIQRVIEAFRLMDEERATLWEIGRRIGVHPGSVRGLLENEIYLGWRVYDERRDPLVKHVQADGRQGWRPKKAREQDEIIRVKVIDEPAISPERFARVQAHLGEIRGRHAISNAARHPSLCTTIGRCGYCGEPLYVTANGKRNKAGKNHGYYCCKSRYPGRSGKLPPCSNGWVRRENLDELLVAFCEKILTEPKLLVTVIEASARRTAQVIRAFRPPTKDDAIRKLRQRDERLLEMCEVQTISIDEFRARRAKIRAEIERLESVAEATKADAPPTVTLTEFARQVTKAVVRFARIESALEKKQILRELFAEVFFRRESVSAFRFSKSFLAELGETSLATQTVQLSTPFHIRELPQPLPKGHKRCICCGRVRPLIDFYSRRARCRDCYKEALNQRRRERRKAQKTATQQPNEPEQSEASATDALRAEGVPGWKGGTFAPFCVPIPVARNGCGN
jgi:DNA invertase Pin-like site-specific DNA recombinase